MSTTSKFALCVAVAIFVSWFVAVVYFIARAEPSNLTCNDLMTGDKLINTDSDAHAIVVHLNAETVALEFQADHRTDLYNCDDFAALNGWTKVTRTLSP